MRLGRGIEVTKYYFIIVLMILVGLGCSGRSPEPSWTAEEYFDYAKELYNDEDYFESANEFIRAFRKSLRPLIFIAG